MCLSIRGVGSPNIIIHGPPGAHDIWDATKNFLNLVDFDVNMFKEKARTKSPDEYSQIKKFDFWKKKSYLLHIGYYTYTTHICILYSYKFGINILI